jgi:hypothetical protein
MVAQALEINNRHAAVLYAQQPFSFQRLERLVHPLARATPLSPQNP